jgi:hypothetical protein
MFNLKCRQSDITGIIIDTGSKLTTGVIVISVNLGKDVITGVVDIAFKFEFEFHREFF